MGFYARHVLPHLIDLGVRNPENMRLRAEWIPRARGDVLEIGIGSGVNLPFYSCKVKRVYGVDPSLELQKMARKRTPERLQVEFLLQTAEEPLPFRAESIDTVVITWTLCSVRNVSAALREAKRVLRSDGRLIFIEHGLSPDSSVAIWQNRLTPVWKHFTGGCRLNRKTDALITEAGFRIGELQSGYLAGPRALTYTYQGLAYPEHAGSK